MESLYLKSSKGFIVNDFQWNLHGFLDQKQDPKMTLLMCMDGNTQISMKFGQIHQTFMLQVDKIISFTNRKYTLQIILDNSEYVIVSSKNNTAEEQYGGYYKKNQQRLFKRPFWENGFKKILFNCE